MKPITRVSKNQVVERDAPPKRMTVHIPTDVYLYEENYSVNSLKVRNKQHDEDFIVLGLGDRSDAIID